MTFVNSEIAKLEKVIVHRPDCGIERISPRRAEELLFDDIVHLPLMIEEHNTFTDILKAFVGKENVLETEHLIQEALDYDTALRAELLDKILDYEELPKSYLEEFAKLPNDQLTKVLISGYDDVKDIIYFDPIPNFIFTRDIAITIQDHVIITKAAKEARARENLLTRFIFLAHPMFKELKAANKIINLNNIDLFPPSRKGENVSIEGGDMMMIERDYLLIGCSERTTAHAFYSLKDHLHKMGVKMNMVRINIPAERSFMHIDTLFTRIDTDTVVCYKPIIYDGLGSNVEMHGHDGSHTIYPSVKDFFLGEINPNMNFIFSGNGESPYQEREQWTDGCNLVAIQPGVGLTYDRNPKTEISFKENGYQIISAKEFLDDYKSQKIIPSELKKMIIKFPSSELSRARGGSHCMTCPIQRRKY
jgi:arginine deiminase